MPKLGPASPILLPFDPTGLYLWFPQLNMALSFSFDIGHSSIGWSVLSHESRTQETPFPDPVVLGCGSVLFPKDDCLASSRRGFRRTRRNIRSTRNRISRIRALLLHLGVLSEAELDSTGHSAPHHLAAQALRADGPVLTWLEVWHLLRWYAHNRGYDGNSRWSRQGDNEEGDTEKEKAALQLMEQHGTSTMAETICAVLGLDPKSEARSSPKPYKNHKAAFPRKVVRSEVLAILESHKSHLPGLDDAFIDTLVARDDTSGKRAWATVPVPTIKLPRRYFGGLLFGQLIPRFDNRIIAKCPVSGAKVPNKACLEFLEFRWAMILANLKANGNPLSAKQRRMVDAEMREQGRLTATALRKAVERACQTTDTNCKSYFETHPDSADALTLDPANALYHGEGKSSKALKSYWKHLPEISKHRAKGRWKKGRPVTLQWMLDECLRESHPTDELEAEIESAFDKQSRKKGAMPSLEAFRFRTRFSPDIPSGRAPYSRAIMREVVEFVLSTDRHPTEKGRDKLPDGPIYRTSEILKHERNRHIDDLTNNHLIRHRLTILLRLTDDMLRDFAGNDATRVTDIVVEVARDLQEYSGLTAKEMAGELTKRLSHFKAAVDYLAEFAPDLEVTGSLIRKCRIAMDMDWRCPFTGDQYDAYQLKHLEWEHIIPYADRPTNSLDSLVLTFDWVNRLKGKSTALAFILDMADDKRFLTPEAYKTFVQNLKTANKDVYPDDHRRQSHRKMLLMVEQYEARDHGFTQGALTKTSHLNRLSASQLEKRFADPETGEVRVRVTSIPGQVTAETRKGWRLLHTLDTACPECSGKNKTEIRDLTHLHHALDASVLALTHHYLPGNLPGQAENEKGKVWKALLDRNKTEEQVALLMRTGLFGRHYRTDKDGQPVLDQRGRKQLDVHLEDKLFPADLKDQIRRRLAEQRVVQHIPADQSGAALEQNPWRVRSVVDGEAILTQRNTGGTGDKVVATTQDETSGALFYQRKKPPADCKIDRGKRREIDLIDELINRCPQGSFSKKEIAQLRRGVLKITTEKVGKLVGLEPGKLQKNKSVLVIEDNYGLTLEPEPQIIPFHNVPRRLADLRSGNSGTLPAILRNGMLIRVANWPGKEGIWRIVSCKANGRLDLCRPDAVKMESKGTRCWREVSVSSLLAKLGIQILPQRYTGHPFTPQ